MTKDIYADVIVNISVDSLDKAYQYKIPDGIREKVKVGQAVMIPFGVSDRMIKGYVIRISDKPEYDVSRIKSISGLCKKTLDTSERMLQLAAFMKNRYQCTMNEAIKTVMPVKSKVKTVKKKSVVLKLDKEKARAVFLELNSKKNAAARARLLKCLIDSENGILDYNYIKNEENIGPSTFNSLERDGIIAVEAEDVFRNPKMDYGSWGRNVILNEKQQEIADDITGEYEKGIRREYLIHGITGSGKTEVYMAVMEKVIGLGYQVIVLIPEIALTYQTSGRFYKRFGGRVSILNSKMSAGERYDQYMRAKNGNVDVIIGPRSALFAPFERLGLIIIDEEHESGYVSETIPRYSAVCVAGELARLSGASLILGSATPSIETYYRTSEDYKGDKPVKLYRLDIRGGNSRLPNIHVADMREEFKNKNYSIISTGLRNAIGDRLRKNEQVMLFLNRRGFSGFISCRNCGEVVKCPHCDVSLTLHYGHDRKKLVCHYCGYERDMVTTCEKCGSKYIGTFGTGTQKIESMVKEMFPEARVLRMDADTTTGKDGYVNVLESFGAHEADILIGTQMIIKGHDFPLVTLVGIVAADMTLNMSDYRAAERTFQTLVQAAGRAGRGNRPGDVYIQTYNPDHYAVTASVKQDYGEFFNKEINYRRLLSYPPVSGIMSIMTASSKEAYAKKIIDDVARNTLLYFKGNDAAKVIGPAPHFLAKICDSYRFVLYVKCEDDKLLYRLRDMIVEYLDVMYEKKRFDVWIDVD